MTEQEEYQKFVEEMANHCECHPPFDRPCDGVLAGGPCDRMGQDKEFEADDKREDDDEI